MLQLKRSIVDDLSKICSYLIGVIMISLQIMSCGGGGDSGDGGSGGGNISPSITYSGLSNPALIDEKNATILALSSLDGVEYQASSSGIIALSSPDQNSIQGQGNFLANLTIVIRNTADSLDFSEKLESSGFTVFATESGTLSGSCGGTATYNITVNEKTGAFTGSITFQSLCEDGLALSGVATINGNIDLGTETIREFNITFSHVTASSGSYSVTMSGETKLTYTYSNYTAILNMLFRDDTTNQTFKLENYQIIVTETSNYEQISISGLFYYPEYGYVSIQTLEALRVYYVDEYPSSGRLLLTGGKGFSGGFTKALLTVLSKDEFKVEADTNGDGNYDYNSEPIRWSGES
jgi:hypothetical protein